MSTTHNGKDVTCPACKGTRMMDGGGGSRIPCDLCAGSGQEVKQAPGANEIGWLVETEGPSGALWLALSPASYGNCSRFRDWTADATKALRFSRQGDAQAYIEAHMPMSGAHASEHMWVGGP